MDNQFLTYSFIYINFMIYMGFEKPFNQFVSTNDLKPEYPCNLKLWFMCLLTKYFL